MSSWWHVPLCQNHIYTGLSLHLYRKVLENSLKDSLLGYSPQIGANTIFHFLLKKKKIELFIYLFGSLLGLRCCVQAFSSCGEQGIVFVVVSRLLIAVSFLAMELGL